MPEGKKNELLNIIDGQLHLDQEMQRATQLASPTPLEDLSHDDVAYISLILQTKRADVHHPYSKYDQEVESAGLRKREERLAYAEKIHQMHLIGYMLKHNAESFDAELDELLAAENKKRDKYRHY